MGKIWGTYHFMVSDLEKICHFKTEPQCIIYNRPVIKIEIRSNTQKNPKNLTDAPTPPQG